MPNGKPNCPHFYICPNDHSQSKCDGKLELVRLITNQVVYRCTRTSHIFYGTAIPTNDTPCELSERYYYMLGANILPKGEISQTKENADKLSPTIEWDIQSFFRRINEAKQSCITAFTARESIFSLQCPVCARQQKELVESGQHTLSAGHTTIIKIPITVQIVPFCRVCRTIWPENVKPDINNHGGKLDFYLAMLGIIQFCVSVPS